MIELRTHLHDLTLGSGTQSENDEETEEDDNAPSCRSFTEEETRQAIHTCNEQLDNVRGSHPLVHFEVGPDEKIGRAHV